MSAFKLLFLAFLTIPLVEIFLLIEVGSIIGAPSTIGLVVFTAVLGAVLMRAQGFQTLGRVQRSMARGEIPAFELAEGALILLSGALLLTPGFVTDAVGFACLMPPLRRGFIRWAASRRVVRPGTGPRGGHPRTIEGEFRRDDDQRSPRDP